MPSDSAHINFTTRDHEGFHTNLTLPRCIIQKDVQRALIHSELYHVHLQEDEGSSFHLTLTRFIIQHEVNFINLRFIRHQTAWIMEHGAYFNSVKFSSCNHTDITFNKLFAPWGKFFQTF